MRFYSILGLLFSMCIHFGGFGQYANEIILVKRVKDFFIQGKIDSTKTYDWGYTIASKDSNYLKTTVLKKDLADYSSSQIYILDSDDTLNNSIYSGYFAIDLIEHKRHSITSLSMGFKHLNQVCDKTNIFFVGFHVTKENEESFVDVRSTFNSNGTGEKLISGQILNQSTFEPIPFVNIGFFEENIGCVSNIDGHFSMEIPNEYSENLITISCLGFETKKIKTSSFFSANTKIILLDEKSIQLNEVIVLDDRPKQKKTITLGIKKFTGRTSGFINGKGSGAEIARLITSNKRLKITSASIYIGKNVNSEFKLRLNIYSRNSEENFPDQNIMRFSQVISSRIEAGWLEVNLETPVITESDFFISFEWLDSSVGNPLIGVKGKGSKDLVFQRSISLGKWIPSIDFNWVIKCEADILE